MTWKKVARVIMKGGHSLTGEVRQGSWETESRDLEGSREKWGIGTRTQGRPELVVSRARKRKEADARRAWPGERGRRQRRQEAER